MFEGCTSLTSFVLPNGISKLTGTFKGCTSITSFEVPKNILGLYNTFEDCTSLESITIHDNVEAIGRATFKNCTSLKSVTIPSLVKMIEEEAFLGCTSLEEVNLSEGLLSIMIYVFKDCTSLKSINIPSTVILLGGKSFENCTSLKSLVIPDGIDQIGNDLLTGCTSIESITTPCIGGNEGGKRYLGYFFGAPNFYEQGSYIPSSLKQIKYTGQYIFDGAFQDAVNVERIILTTNLKYVGEAAFVGTSLKGLYYEGTYEQYSATDNNSTELISTRPCYYSETKPKENADRFYYYDTDGVTPIMWEEE